MCGGTAGTGGLQAGRRACCAGACSAMGCWVGSGTVGTGSFQAGSLVRHFVPVDGVLLFHACSCNFLRRSTENND